MATSSPIFPIHSCQLFVTKSDPNMALNIIISKEYTYRRILSFVCCYKNSLLLWSLDYKSQTKALLDCSSLIGIDDDEKGVSDPALWSLPSVWLYMRSGQPRWPGWLGPSSPCQIFKYLDMKGEYIWSKVRLKEISKLLQFVAMCFFFLL